MSFVYFMGRTEKLYEMIQHIGWLRIYLSEMDETDWRDMRLRAQRQLVEIESALVKYHRETEKADINEAQIKHMVDRFLGWKLPENFNPDAGISYTRPNYHQSVDATPTGTNLFDAGQADAMVRYMVDGLPKHD